LFCFSTEELRLEVVAIMEIILVLLVSVAVLIVSLYLYRIASGTLVFLNIPNIFFYFYVLMVYVGSILMYLGLDMASLYLGATDKIILTKMLLSTMSGMVLIPCGMILANMVFRFDAKQSFDQYWTAKVERIVSPRDTYVFPFMIIVVAISIVALVMYLRQLSTIPIVALFGGASPAELAYLRSQATNNFGNHIHR
jgi:hypothetical protein